MRLGQTFWDVETAAQQLAHQVVHTLPVTVASVALWDRPSFSLTVKGVSGLRECKGSGAVGSRILLALSSGHRQVLERGEPLLLDGNEPAGVAALDDAALTLASNLKWAYLIPLRIDDEQIGVLGLGEMRSTDREPLTEEKQARCRSIVDEFRTTWGQIWEVARLHRQVRATVPVLQMVGRMLQARTYRDVLACCASEVSDWLGTPVRGILLRAASGPGMDVVATWNLPPLTPDDSRQLLMALTREGGDWKLPVRITRVVDDPLDPLAPSSQTGAPWSRVTLPLLGGDRVLGVVCLYVEDDLEPAEWDLELFRRRAEIVSVGVEVVTALEDHRHEVEALSRTASDLLSTHRHAVLHQALVGVSERMSTRFSDQLQQFLGELQDGVVTAALRRFGALATQELRDTLSELQEAAAGANGSSGSVVEINELVRQALVIARGTWDEAPRQRGVSLELTFEPHGQPLLVRSSTALIGAVICAIENAVEALPEGGRISVRTGQSNGHAVIAVADSGPGLEAAHREQAFAPLFSTKGKRHLGLGLSVVRALATRYGGEATLEAGENGGTTLILRLPVTAALGA